MQLPTLDPLDEQKIRRRIIKSVSLSFVTLHRLIVFSLLLLICISSYKGTIGKISPSSMYKLSWGVGVTGTLLIFIDYIGAVVLHLYA